MSFVIDLAIILIAVSAVYLGIMRGFVRSVMGFLSVILAVVAAYVFTAPVAAWLDERIIGGWVSGIVDESLTGIVRAGTQNLELDKIFADRPEALTAIAEQFGADLDAIAAHYYDVLAGAAEQEALAELSELIASPTANAISIALAALGVFIAALIVLKFITFFLDMICRLPLLDRLNTFLGLLFGAASAVVLAWVTANLAAAIVLAFQSIEPGVFNESVISGSIIVKFMREQGWILFA
ncbi:MAG: CvpA family protein [Clostridia bacterium]|nr:CvpA family protein [Clostridia bacterium]